MKKAVVFEAARTGYGIDQVDAITVGELIELLQEYDPETLFILSHDRGYTFGSVSPYDCYRAEEQEDGDFVEVERAFAFW